MYVLSLHRMLCSIYHSSKKMLIVYLNSLKSFWPQTSPEYDATSPKLLPCHFLWQGRENSLIFGVQSEKNTLLEFLNPRFLKSCTGIWEKYRYSFGQAVWILVYKSCLHFQTSFYCTNLGLLWNCKCLPSSVAQLERELTTELCKCTQDVRVGLIVRLHFKNIESNVCKAALRHLSAATLRIPGWGTVSNMDIVSPVKENRQITEIVVTFFSSST